MRVLTSGTKAQTLKQHNVEPWVWLYEIILEESVDATRPFRVTSFNEEVTLSGVVYRPFPIVHEAIAGDSSGNLPQFTLSASNVTRELNYYVEQAKGLSGNRVTITVASKAAFTLNDSVSFTFEVSGVVLADDVVTLRLQLPSFYQYPVPAELFVRARCRWRYKDENCRYRGAIATCDKTLAGANGCIVHGNDEVANNLPRLHPRQYGGFPAIQRFVA